MICDSNEISLSKDGLDWVNESTLEIKYSNENVEGLTSHGQCFGRIVEKNTCQKMSVI